MARRMRGKRVIGRTSKVGRTQKGPVKGLHGVKRLIPRGPARLGTGFFGKVPPGTVGRTKSTPIVDGAGPRPQNLNIATMAPEIVQVSAPDTAQGAVSLVGGLPPAAHHQTVPVVRRTFGGAVPVARSMSVDGISQTAFMVGSPGLGDVIDITPGIPGHDLQVIDRGNVLIDAKSGRVLRAVSVRAKLQKRRRPSGRGAGAGIRREIENLKQQNMMFLMMAMQGGCRR